MNSDMVTISKDHFGKELQEMVRSEMTAVLKPERMNNSLMSPENLDHHIRIAEIFAKSGLVPKNYIGKPMDILIAMEMGNQLGLPYMQALQDIAVINGKPCLYGDGFLAVIKSHPDYEWMEEGPVMVDTTMTGYSVTIKRRNHEPHTVVFTLDDARKANLLGKQGPWKDYPGRMMKWRAASWCGRDVFPDALRGMKSAEEERDFIEGELDYTQKKPQTEALKQKLKGFADATNTNIANPNPDLKPGPYPSSAIHLPQEVTQGNNESGMADNGEPEVAGVAEEKQHHAITQDQLANIHTLIMDKNIAKERTDKVLNKLGVSDFESLSKEDADRLLTFLEKAQ